jgi:hypothetical protein
MEFHHPEGLTALVPRLFVDAFGALPLRVAAGRILYLGFEDHLDPALALAVERMTGLQVEGGLVEESAFHPAHARLLEARFPAAELIEAATEPALSAAFAKAVERSRPVESRLARVHDCLWLRMWLRPQSGPVAGSAAAMSVIMTDPSQVAAAGAGNGTGDNSNAVAMAGLANGLIVNGQTPINYYSNFVSTPGSTVSEVQTENTAQNASVTQLQTQNNALSSVNLNDEAAAMSTLENSYQAASQVFTILNTVMASALNLGQETAVA